MRQMRVLEGVLRPVRECDAGYSSVHRVLRQSEPTKCRGDLHVNPHKLVRAHVRELRPYAPVFPYEVLAERVGKPPDRIVKLDANENPYGITPRVAAAIANTQYPHIYPDPEASELRRALSEFTGVPAQLLIAGAGADDLIDLVVRVFLDPGDCALGCPPTFGMYGFDTAIADATMIDVQRSRDFSLDVDAIERVCQQRDPKLLFVTCPNNPDGGWLPNTELDRLLALPLVVVLDEAYIEFAGCNRSRAPLVCQHDNLVVLRTFSKWAALAGLRVGYGAFPAWLVPYVMKIKQPYSVSAVASGAAIAALNDPSVPETVNRIVTERDRLHSLLAGIPFLHPYPSHANFVLCKVVGRDARSLKAALEEQGILVRYFDRPGMRDHIRISIGRPEHTDTLLAFLKGW